MLAEHSEECFTHSKHHTGAKCYFGAGNNDLFTHGYTPEVRYVS